LKAIYISRPIMKAPSTPPRAIPTFALLENSMAELDGVGLEDGDGKLVPDAEKPVDVDRGCACCGFAVNEPAVVDRVEGPSVTAVILGFAADEVVPGGVFMGDVSTPPTVSVSKTAERLLVRGPDDWAAASVVGAGRADAWGVEVRAVEEVDPALMIRKAYEYWKIVGSESSCNLKP
jgi:hypothetical protein